MSLAHLVPEPSSGPPKSRYLTPKTNPIPLLPGDLAKYYSLAHTVQLSLYYYLRSRSLIDAPLTTLVQDLVPLAVSQAAFCAVCLPQAGSWISGTNAKSFVKGTTTSSNKKRVQKPSGMKPLQESDTSSRVSNSILAALLALLLPSVPLAALAMVLGAPLYPISLIPHTFLLAIHVSLLATTPIFYTHGLSSSAWHDVAGAWLPLDEAGVWAGVVGCLVGGWIGAVPMALDWDRDWQGWPCTVLWGSLGGWVTGRLITGVARLGVGRRIDMGVSESGTKVD